MSLSSRGLARAALVSPGGPMFGLFQAIKSEWRPDYDEGISRLDVSENDLMLDVMSLTFKHISAGILSNCFSCADGTALSSSRTLLSSLAQFINRYFSPNVAVVEDQLIAGTGCSSLLEALAPVLCDPGDIVLTPGPMWPVSRLILGKSQVVLSPVVPSANSVDAILRWDDRLESIWQDRIDDLVSTGKRPRAIILSNPQNPMGKCYSKAYLVGMMYSLSKDLLQNDLFLISDEVFALSQHEGDDGLEKFQSILSLNPERDAGCDPRRLIVLWSVSKDFGATASR
ncbi:pyridoxal phosphate-dependent transferase [Coprinopsis sp. MPI-PUGE-AT-0042]|nr:pyridoxal phosphate-dependent transferase [Coprinopsis sp. MPI-PUGE-AT-0042]